MPKPKKPAVIVLPAPTAPGGAKPMAHADSPRVIADSAEFRTETPSSWRCAADGQTNDGARCTTCGTGKP